MFKKDLAPIGEHDKVSTIIGLGTEIRGSVKATGGLRVDGRVEGEITHEGDIVVGEEGVVEANVKTRNATIAGEVRGNIEASGRVEIISTGKVFGDINVATLIINEGAVFEGNCQMGQPSGGEDLARRSSSKAARSSGDGTVAEAAATKE